MNWVNLQRIARTRKGWYLNYNISGRNVWPVKASHFLVARHWNSDTPIIPRDPLKSNNSSDLGGSLGGGYFLRHHGIGIAIDPGHAFLKCLYERHSITIADIDIIIITHFHQDHCGDITNCITLSRINNKKIIIFAPTPVIQFLELLGETDLNPISPGMSLRIDCEDNKILEIEFLPTLHWQTITPKSFHISRFPTFIDFHLSAVGVKIDLVCNSDNQLVNKRIVISGDTFFPNFTSDSFCDICYDLYLGPGRSYINLNKVNRITYDSLKRILEMNFYNFLFAYLDLKADIVCYHIGSLEKAFSDYSESTPLDFQYDGFHLGVLGILRLMGWMDIETQKLVVITEWGEELRGERKNITKLIEEQSTHMRKKNREHLNNLVAFPSDVDLLIDIGNDLLKCDDHCSFHDYHHMAAQEQNSEYIKYRSNLNNPQIDEYEPTCDWKIFT